LLLDDSTDNIEISTTNWLVSALKSFAGAIVLGRIGLTREVLRR